MNHTCNYIIYCWTMAGFLEHFHIAPVAAVSSSLLSVAERSLARDSNPLNLCTSSLVLSSSAHWDRGGGREGERGEWCTCISCTYKNTHLEDGGGTMHFEFGALQVQSLHQVLHHALWPDNGLVHTLHTSTDTHSTLECMGVPILCMSKQAL